MRKIDVDQLRAYAHRPWAAMERSKREFIADAARADPAGHARSVAELRAHLRLVRPEWPTAEDLDRDLADHIALKRKIDRASALWCARHDRSR